MDVRPKSCGGKLVKGKARSVNGNTQELIVLTPRHKYLFCTF
jgi:hypothetical protein